MLTRAIQHETKGSAAYKELVRALDELTGVFYTEKAQSMFAAADALADSRPRDTIDQLQEALKAEDRNPTILRELARVHLQLDECDKADARVKQAEEIDSYSVEIKLLRLQILECQKNLELLETKLATHDSDLDPVEKFSRGLQMRLLLHGIPVANLPAATSTPTTTGPSKDLKKAKAFLATWEAQAPDYPELYYWKWEFSKLSGDPDRTAAAKYTQLCQNLTPRRRKSFSLDVDLCKGKEAVDVFLKESTATTAPTPASGAAKHP